MTSSEKPKRKPGPPRREFDQRVADRICDGIVDGKSLRRICTEKWAPSKKIVLRWLEEQAAFAQQYARAREEQADGYADELLELGKQANSENAHAIRVRADIIKWVCSKLKPKKYGDRVALDAEVKVEEKVVPGWARSLYNITPNSPPEARLINWPREDKFERARRMLSELHGIGHELSHHWGITEAEQACLALCKTLAKPMDNVVEGKPPYEVPAPLPLSAPADAGGPEPITRARDSGDDDVVVIE